MECKGRVPSGGIQAGEARVTMARFSRADGGSRSVARVRGRVERTQKPRSELPARCAGSNVPVIWYIFLSPRSLAQGVRGLGDVRGKPAKQAMGLYLRSSYIEYRREVKEMGQSQSATDPPSRTLSPEWMRTRAAAIHRDDGVCAFCGFRAWGYEPPSEEHPAGVIPTHTYQADHILAVEHGGSDDLSNVRTLCCKCHREHHQ